MDTKLLSSAAEGTQGGELLGALYLQHRFDLLGSCWQDWSELPGETGDDVSAGVESSRRLFSGMVSCASARDSLRIASQLAPNYRRIHWQRDVKSGHLWSVRTWYKDIRWGDRAGADVKVPWEIARLQHLIILATEYHTRSLSSDSESAAHMAIEYRNQVIDFIAANPPRYGVGWACTMDVAIRAANLLISFDLFRAFGHIFDQAFVDIFTNSIVDHGEHIFANLEWNDEYCGNHYLANIVGLLFVAAYLPVGEDANCWLSFSLYEFISQSLIQFHPEGSNFEGSTAYHGLSAEMLVFGCALVLGLSEHKKQAISFESGIRLRSGRNQRVIDSILDWQEGRREAPFPDAMLKRLHGARRFIEALVRPDGQLAQFGDNDSGCFCLLSRVVSQVSFAYLKRRYSNIGMIEKGQPDPYPLIEPMNPCYLLEMMDSLLGDPFLRDSDERLGWPARIIRALSQSQNLGSCRPVTQNCLLRRADNLPLEPNDTALEQVFTSGSDLHEGIELHVFSDFGLYIWKSQSLYLAVRCGDIGQKGFGGHAHNDQLSIELWVEGEPIFLDPGTYTYSADPNMRNMYRSVKAHNAPQFDWDNEPGDLNLGLFQLGNESQAQVHGVDRHTFIGAHRGYGFNVYRKIMIGTDSVMITDWHDGDRSLKFSLPKPLPYSPGYGWIERKPTGYRGL
ncbi:alginate lyase family protein [Motiliproteus sediminis]|uniref:alginate lyase family protein n=1 Tax=Motiliproteus sediminis TaxID=1468178 RepID=UPI001AEF6A24|nr:alginate lyase family protein [Motiliproteus sediminis]